MKVLYRVVTADNGYEVHIRDDEGFWSCIKTGCKTFGAAQKIADRYQHMEETQSAAASGN